MTGGVEAPPAPLISVVLAVFNRPQMVARAVDSVLGQRHPSLEIIAVDDGSTDDTPAVLRSYGGRLRLITQPHQGAYAARNAGIRGARGDLIAFIDSDDAWLEGRLDRQVPMLADPQVGMVFGDALVDDRRPGPRRVINRTVFDIIPPYRADLAEFAYGCFVPFSTVLARRQCFEQCGEFDTTTRLGADYLKWFQISTKYRLAYVSQPVAIYALHPGNSSRDLVQALESRMRLFRAELDRVTDNDLSQLLRHLLFNLHLYLVWAHVRQAHWRRTLQVWRSLLMTERAEPLRSLGWAARLVTRRLVARRWFRHPRQLPASVHGLAPGGRPVSSPGLGRSRRG